MKKMILFSVLTVLAGGGIALAHGHGHGHAGRMLQHLDANKDGKITLTEMQTEATRHFAEADADKDGRVVQAEWKAHQKKMRAQFTGKHKDIAAKGDKERGECRGEEHAHGRFFEKLDQNDDGAVDNKELTTHLQKKFTRIDANGDKVVSGDELQLRRGKHGRGHHERGRDDHGQAGSSGAHD